MLEFKVMSVIGEDDGLGGWIETTVISYEGLGYLDMLTGTNQHTIQNAITEQSTHILICDWFQDYRQKITDKMIVEMDGRSYRITYVDNPVNANSHLEIYLKYDGEIDD